MLNSSGCLEKIWKEGFAYYFYLRNFRSSIIVIKSSNDFFSTKFTFNIKSLARFDDEFRLTTKNRKKGVIVNFRKMRKIQFKLEF